MQKTPVILAGFHLADPTTVDLARTSARYFSPISGAVMLYFNPDANGNIGFRDFGCQKKCGQPSLAQ